MDNAAPWLHPKVHDLMEKLEKETGTPATLTSRPGYWHVEHGNDRIRLTCTYRRSTGRKLTYRSELYRDGQRCERVSGMASYARLFNDPDLEHPDRTPGRKLTPVMPLQDGEELPSLVAQFEGVALKASTVAAIEVGHCVRSTRELINGQLYRVPVNDTEEDYTADPDLYAVRITKPGGDQVQLVFAPTGYHGTHALDTIEAVDAQGGDMLSELADRTNFTAMLEHILGFRLPGPNTNPAQHNARGKDTRGAVTNSVEVRKATVFRV